MLHGSLTLGDFAPGRSDIDLMLITGPEGLSRTEREQIVEADGSANTAAAKAIDLIAITSTVAQRPTRAPACEISSRATPTTSTWRINDRQTKTDTEAPICAEAVTHVLRTVLDQLDARA